MKEESAASGGGHRTAVERTQVQILPLVTKVRKHSERRQYAGQVLEQDCLSFPVHVMDTQESTCVVAVVSC